MAAKARLDRRKSHVQLSGGRRDESIQKKILTALRQKGKRLQDLFKAMDDDGNRMVDRNEFSDALKRLNIIGGIEDYYSLFDSWDVDGSGSLDYGEILKAVSGRRYDAFEAFDADLGNRNAHVAANALEAYQEAGRREAAGARREAAQEFERQQKWLRSRWHVAQQAVSVAMWLARKANESSSDEDDEEERKTEAATAAQVAVAAGTKPTPHGELAMPPADGELEEAARREITRLNELALTCHLSASGEEQLDAENALVAYGVSYEHLALEPKLLLPLLSQMAFARIVGSSEGALQRLPEPSFWGPVSVPSLPPPPPPSLGLSSGRRTRLAMAPTPGAAADDADDDNAAPVAMVLVARLRADESLDWLAGLPPRVSVHVVQAHGGGADPALPTDRQTVLDGAVGGVGHAYLVYLAAASRASDVYRMHRAKLRNRHVRLGKHEQKQSIQQKIHDACRAKGHRVRDIFLRWDCDKSNTVTKDEFRRALQELKIMGSGDDYDSLFDACETLLLPCPHPAVTLPLPCQIPAPPKPRPSLAQASPRPASIGVTKNASWTPLGVRSVSSGWRRGRRRLGHAHLHGAPERAERAEIRRLPLGAAAAALPAAPHLLPR